ncbi:flagellar protein FlbD [Halanaerobacter jeridensis]|uniref:Flagellar protein FlbD n=1 Tax=Halanaerobacter jeridensis TaxID=706427 RepID=A0A938XQ31_9FIRM|nr:flagellar protein FlbD [Halanaerobacter jeridensis]
MINADLIESVQATPDTVVKLTSGYTIIVQEDVDLIIDKVINYQRKVNFKPE